jgi:hypothetical protein
MNLKEKIRIAGIRQKDVAEKAGCTVPWVCSVLGGYESSSKVVKVANELLDEEIKKKPYLKPLLQHPGA